jgi:uncharacterized RDD family membrane protein YckC
VVSLQRAWKGGRLNSELRIQTPEGIVFAYPLAGPLVRCVAWAVDLVAIVAITSTLNTLAQLAGIFSRDLGAALGIAVYFLVSIGYGVTLEWLWRGQTIGKRAMRLRVMDVHGLRLQFHQVLMRNLLRFVDLLPAFYAVGGVACLLSQRAQRLGDLAANTVVVRLLRQAEPDLDQLLAGKFNSLRRHPHLVARLRQRVAPEEARLALQAIVRRDELDPGARVELFTQLAEHFRTRVVFPAEDVEAVPDEQYVRNVVDVLFRTRAPAR